MVSARVWSGSSVDRRRSAPSQAAAETPLASAAFSERGLHQTRRVLGARWTLHLAVGEGLPVRSTRRGAPSRKPPMAVPSLLPRPPLAAPGGLCCLQAQRWCHIFEVFVTRDSTPRRNFCVGSLAV